MIRRHTSGSRGPLCRALIALHSSRKVDSVTHVAHPIQVGCKRRCRVARRPSTAAATAAATTAADGDAHRRAVVEPQPVSVQRKSTARRGVVCGHHSPRVVQACHVRKRKAAIGACTARRSAQCKTLALLSPASNATSACKWAEMFDMRDV
jgi:hypothetical protein